MGLEKIGLHCLNGGPGSGDLLRAGLRLVKYVNDAPPADLPEWVTIIYRYDFGFDPVHNWFLSPPVDAARNLVNLLSPHLVNVPKRAFIEGSNESDADTVEKAQWFGDFEAERVRILLEMGYRSCVVNSGVGRPPLPNEGGSWAALVPMLTYAKRAGAILGGHGYGWPMMKNNAEWLVLRYRKVYDYLATVGLGDMPFVLTEMGIDPLIEEKDKAPYTGRGAFRDQEWREFIRVQFGAGDPDRFLLDDCRWLNSELMKDKQVIGGCLFSDGEGWGWGSYDYSGQPFMSLVKAELEVPVTIQREIWVIPHGTPAPVFSDPDDIPGYKQVGQMLESSLHTPLDPPELLGPAAWRWVNGKLWYHVRGTNINPPGWAPSWYRKAGQQVPYFDTNAAQADGFPGWNTPEPPPAVAKDKLADPTFAERPLVGPPAGSGISGNFSSKWKLIRWSKPGDPKFDRQGQDWLPPENRVIQFGADFPEGYLVYDKDDPTGSIDKFFKGDSPTGGEFVQDIELSPGTWTLYAPVFPDHWHRDKARFGDRRVRPSLATSDDYWMGSLVMVSLGSATTGLQSAKTVPIGRYTRLPITLRNHPGGVVRVSVQFWGRWGFENDCWFWDGLEIKPGEPEVDKSVANPAEPATASKSGAYGVNLQWWLLNRNFGDQVDRYIAEMEALGVTRAQIGLDIYQIDRPDGYDFKRYDYILPKLAAKFPISAIVYTAPAYWMWDGMLEWDNHGWDQPLNQIYTPFLSQVVERMARRYPFIKTWTFWNEPEGNHPYALRQPGVYKVWFQAFSSALKGILPEAETFVGLPFTEDEGVIRGFISGLGELDNTGFNVHPYRHGDPSQALNFSLIDAVHSQTGKPVMIGEWGEQTTNPAKGFTEEVQARNVKAALDWIAERDWVRGAYLLAVRDWSEGGISQGLCRPDWSRKPAWSVFQQESGGFNPPPPTGIYWHDRTAVEKDRMMGILAKAAGLVDDL